MSHYVQWGGIHAQIAIKLKLLLHSQYGDFAFFFLIRIAHILILQLEYLAEFNFNLSV